VSDFVGRMAARAVGISVVAQPRIPGVFEEQAAGEPASIAVIDAEVIAPRPSPREPAPSAPATPPPDASIAREATSEPRDEATAPPLERLAAPSPVEKLRPSYPVPDHDGRDEQAALPRPHARPRTQPDEPTSAPAVAARPAPPAVPALAFAAPSASSRPAAAPQAEPPAVRVHIGRLEVRANVQEPPREPRRREVARAEGLSLSDYLRGKRGGP
jgi:hypothetical protein